MSVGTPSTVAWVMLQVFHGTSTDVTECVIAEKKEPEPAMPASGPGMGGGMGGMGGMM